MKLIRFGEAGGEKPGVLFNGGVRVDVSGIGADYNEEFFAGDGLEKLSLWLQTHASSGPRVPDSIRLGPPICRPSKIVCIGLNYRDHAAESQMDAPREPVIFFKSTSAIVGPNDPIRIPRSAQKVDWEVELAVVIGKRFLRFGRSGSRPRGRICSAQRLFRAQFSVGTWGPVGERKERGQFRTARAVPCNARRTCKFRQPRDVAESEWRIPPAQLDFRNDFRRAVSFVLR
jgi:Fumarylacetoacetate (FAA) hydrolase family